MVVPRRFFTGPLRGAGWFSLSEPDRCSDPLAVSAGGPGFCFSAEHVLTERRLRFPGHTLTPQLVTEAGFGPFSAPGTSRNSGQQSPSPVSLYRRTEWSVWNPFGTTGGTPTHSRRTALKLKQL